MSALVLWLCNEPFVATTHKEAGWKRNELQQLNSLLMSTFYSTQAPLYSTIWLASTRQPPGSNHLSSWSRTERYTNGEPSWTRWANIRTTETVFSRSSIIPRRDDVRWDRKSELFESPCSQSHDKTPNNKARRAIGPAASCIEAWPGFRKVPWSP